MRQIHKEVRLTAEAWQYPLIHKFKFAFGLSAEDTDKASTIVPFIISDEALVDYELVKVHPNNADFTIAEYPNVCKGSKVTDLQINWKAFIPPDDTEISLLSFDELNIHTNFLRRLDATDELTGNDIETLIELTHETTDKQVYPLWNGTKLFEGHLIQDYHANVPGLTTDQQPEGVAFDKDTYFKAMHYYTNKEMLKQVTSSMRTHTISEPAVPHGRAITGGSIRGVPSVCKAIEEYTFFGKLFSVPQVGSRFQYHKASQTTAKEHLTVIGEVTFYERNNGFNFAVS